MKDYSKVFTSFWTSADIRKMPEDARMLALYLLTSPHSNMIGCFRIPDAYVADDMQWGSERVSKGFAELYANGFATKGADHWCVIHNFLKWNPIENPNQGIAAARQFEQVPVSSPAKSLCANALSLYAGKVDPASYEPFRNPTATLPEPVTVTVTVTGAVAVTGTVAVAVDANAKLPGGSDEPTPASVAGEVAVVPKQPKKPGKAKSEASEANIATWNAYATAYGKRYGVEPARNASVNGIIAKLVAAVGQQDAPLIARYYVNLNAEFYTRKCHDLKLLLADAQAVRTQWLTNRQVTSASARSMDKQQASLSGIEEFLRDKYGDPVDPEIKTVDAEVLS